MPPVPHNLTAALRDRCRLERELGKGGRLHGAGRVQAQRSDLRAPRAP